MGKKTIEKNAITEGVIWKQLLIFFFPIMLGTLIQQLYTTVDTIIVGRFVGKAALASVGGPAAVLSTIVVTFFNGLANGAAVIIAQYYGAKDRKSLHVGVHTVYLFSIVISLIVSLTGTVLTPWLLKIMNTPQGYDGRFYNLSQNLLYGNSVYAGLQYGIGNHEGGRRFQKTASLSADLLCDEYHTGHCHGGRNEDGDCGGSTRNGYFTMCQCSSGYLVVDQGI